MGRSWNITKWCKSITDSGKDEHTGKDTAGMTERFRLLDDDGVVYACGKAREGVDFEPLDYYMCSYGFGSMGGRHTGILSGRSL